tara:strand:- start:123 stop:962 length:840 start_codon:yes stop_codon:yes gene_type:complete
MAKKKKAEVVEEPQVENTPIVEAPLPEPKPVVKKETPKKDQWEIKERTYFLKGYARPLSFQLKSCGIYWFDEEKGYERELKYTKNQRTVFVDEMTGDQRMDGIVFRNGVLNVPREKTVLQKLLSLYHPHKDILYTEFKPQVIAENELDNLEFEVEAMSVAKDLDIDVAEAVMRAEIGSKVSKMSSKELRRDLLLFAKRNPQLFLELVTDDNVMLRNFGIRATEAGIIQLSGDQRNFLWKSNGRKLMTVPFDEHPYSALANWFKTDEGMEVYSNIEKRLN